MLFWVGTSSVRVHDFLPLQGCSPDVPHQTLGGTVQAQWQANIIRWVGRAPSIWNGFSRPVFAAPGQARYSWWHSFVAQGIKSYVMPCYACLNGMSLAAGSTGFSFLPVQITQLCCNFADVCLPVSHSAGTSDLPLDQLETLLLNLHRLL